MRKLAPALALLVSLTAAADDCTPILILGTYHMNNPGRDAHNIEADDVLSEKRQKEIAAVTESLATFRPTKVLIESPHWTTHWSERYAQWLDGRYTMGRNEIEQLGFRIASKMKHTRLWPVDYPMWVSGLTPAEQHTPKKKPAPATPPAKPAPLPPEIQARQDRIRSSTVTQSLAFFNSPEQYRQNHRWDVIENLTPGEGPALYENTDLATNWYKRNLRIFTNIMEVTEPGDRLLLIIGAGHLKILRDLAGDHPSYCLEDTAKYLASSS
jgi:hypothetical protein